MQTSLSELNERFLRTLADYHNSQRRASANEREASLQGIRSVILNVLPIIDHFDLALSQDTARASAEQIAAGVRLIRDELLKVLSTHGVAFISPVPGDEFDPVRHQAVTRQAVAGIEPGRVAATLKPGTLLQDRVIRPALVAVAMEPEPGPGGGSGGGGGGGGGDGGDGGGEN